MLSGLFFFTDLVVVVVVVVVVVGWNGFDWLNRAGNDFQLMGGMVKNGNVLASELLAGHAGNIDGSGGGSDGGGSDGGGSDGGGSGGGGGGGGSGGGQMCNQPFSFCANFMAAVAPSIAILLGWFCWVFFFFERFRASSQRIRHQVDWIGIGTDCHLA